MKYASIILFSLFFLNQPAMSETLSFNCTAGNTVFKDALQINKEVEQARFGEWPFASYSENQSAIGWSVSRLEGASLDVASFVFVKNTLSLKLAVLSSAVDPSKERLGVWQCVQPLR